MDRVQADGYTYVPTPLPPGGLPKGHQLMYEASLARGKQWYVDQYQVAIDSAEELGLNVEGLQSAFDEVQNYLFVGDLTRDYNAEEHKKLSDLIGKAPGKTAKKRDRQIWSAKSSLVNLAAGLSDFASSEGDEKIESLLFPALEELLK